jgi:lysophospholipid acyltransferase
VIKGLLTSNKVKDFLASWNISVHEWLKYYVYLRLLDKKSRGSGNAFAALVSFFVSAIWHGFYPGFYSFFFGCFVVDLWNKLASPVVGTSFTFLPTPIINAFLTAFYYVPCSYFAISFVLLNFSDFHPVYMSMGYCVHLFFLGTIPILIALQPKRKPRPQPEQLENKKTG